MDKFDFTDELQRIIVVITPCCACSGSDDNPWPAGEDPGSGSK